MIIGSDRKKLWKKVTSEKNQGLQHRVGQGRTQGSREVEVGIFLLGNGKNNVIVDKVLSYF